MIVRYGIYEGSVAPDDHLRFNQNMEDEVVPMLARMPGVMEVRLLRGLAIGTLTPRYHQMIELSFADDAGLIAAMNSAERRDVGRVQAPSLDLFVGHTPHANFAVTRRVRGAGFR